jgi:hypothetical protein
MKWNIPELVGTKVNLDKTLFEIRGIVPKMPFSPIQAGEVVELLVRRVA